MRDPEPRPNELAENDPVLASLGYDGQPGPYRKRTERMRALAVEGKGPLAYLDRLLAAWQKGRR